MRAIVTAAALSVAAWSVAATETPRPVANGTACQVCDHANVIPDPMEREMADTLLAFEMRSTVEVAVVTVETLGGRDVHRYAHDLFEEWGIGKAETDNGLLFLWCPSERKYQVMTGYGLEGDLPDLACKRIVDEHWLPELRTGDVTRGASGLRDAVMATVAYLHPAQKELRAEQARIAERERKRRTESLLGGLVWALTAGLSGLLLLFISPYWPPSVRRKREYRKALEQTADAAETLRSMGNGTHDHVELDTAHRRAVKEVTDHLNPGAMLGRKIKDDQQTADYVEMSRIQVARAKVMVDGVLASHKTMSEAAAVMDRVRGTSFPTLAQAVVDDIEAARRRWPDAGENPDAARETVLGIGRSCTDRLLSIARIKAGKDVLNGDDAARLRAVVNSLNGSIGTAERLAEQAAGLVTACEKADEWCAKFPEMLDATMDSIRSEMHKAGVRSDTRDNAEMLFSKRDSWMDTSFMLSNPIKRKAELSRRLSLARGLLDEVRAEHRRHVENEEAERARERRRRASAASVSSGGFSGFSGGRSSGFGGFGGGRSGGGGVGGSY